MAKTVSGATPVARSRSSKRVPVVSSHALRFPHAAAVELAHPLVAHAAALSRTRALVIKGPVSALYGLRPERLSADVDVLVERAGLDDLCAMLMERGWHAPVQRDVPRVLVEHSRTFIHDEWPCAIDVHHYFPGFFADPDEAFEALWASRRTVTLAHRPVVVPGRPGMAVLMALHAMRTPAESLNDAELTHLRSVIRNDFTEAERKELLSIATVGRARWVLRDLDSDLGVPPADDASPAEKRVWRQTQLDSTEKSALLWSQELKQALRSFQIHRVWRMTWVRRADVPRSFVDELPTRAEHWRYQWQRWKRGLGVMTARWSARSDGR